MESIDSAAFVIMESLEAAAWQYALLEKTVKEHKNTHRDIKDSVMKLGNIMSAWKKDTIKKWFEEHKWEKVEVPTFEVDTQTPPGTERKTRPNTAEAGSQTETKEETGAGGLNERMDKIEGKLEEVLKAIDRKSVV